VRSRTNGRVKCFLFSQTSEEFQAESVFTVSQEQVATALSCSSTRFAVSGTFHDKCEHAQGAGIDIVLKLVEEPKVTAVRLA